MWKHLHRCMLCLLLVWSGWVYAGQSGGSGIRQPADDPPKQQEETDEARQPVPLPVVTVYGGLRNVFRPVHRQQLDQQALQARPFGTMDQVLQSLTAAHIRSYGPGVLATASLRGGAGSHTHMLWNGFTLNSPMNGSTDLSLLPSAMVRVMRSDNPNRYRYVNSTLPDRPHAIQEMASQSMQGLMTGARWSGRRMQTTQIHFWWQENNRQIPPSLVQSHTGAHQADHAARLTASWQQNRHRSVIQWRGAWFSEGIHYTDSIGLSSQNQWQTLAQQADILWQPRSGWLLMSGVQVRLLKARADEYSQARQRNELTGLLSLQWTPPEKAFEINMSARQDYTTGHDIPFTPSVRISYRIRPLVNLHLGSGKNVRLPSLNDLYWQPGGNPDLLPENGWSHDLGVEWNQGQLKGNDGRRGALGMESMERMGTINGFVSPRYMLAVNEQKAYVTDLFGNSVSVVDLVGNAVTGGIAVSGWTEELAVFAGQVVVAGAGSGYLYFLDPQTDALTDSLYLGASPSRLHIDAEGHLWVLCSGSWDGSEKPMLVRIRPQNTGLMETFPLPEENSYYGRFDISADGRKLFVLGQDVWMMDLGKKNPTFELWIESEGMTFYGLSVSPFSNRLYLTDAVDFVQRGTLMVYSETGQLLGSHLLMVNPSGFYHH